MIVGIHRVAIGIPRAEAMKALLIDAEYYLVDNIGQTWVFKNRKLS